MKNYIYFLFFLISGGLFAGVQKQKDPAFCRYLEEREVLVTKNKDLAFDSEVELSIEEKRVACYFEELKKELVTLYKKEGKFPPSRNFLLEKEQIRSTLLFSFIEQMPKGGLLHVHSGSVATAKWMVEELATGPNCYVYWEENGPILQGTIHFYPDNEAPPGFVLIGKLRKSIEGFNDKLISMLEMEPEDLQSDTLWKKFEESFARSTGLIHYKPCFIKYYTHALEELIKDNIQYMELRSLNNTIYELDGTIECPDVGIGTFIEIKKELQKKHPDFNFNLIYTEHREDLHNQKLCRVERAYRLRSLYPDFIIGYDLVGEEETGASTLSYVGSLQRKAALQEKYEIDLPCYFHAGETLLSSSGNLYDAVLLKCKRVGHALNLFLFPYLIEKMIEEDICVEVCPISNQVLGYVSDLRVHPAAGYLKAGVPCVLSSDDPGLFGYYGMTPDIWEAVMAWDLDLKALKQLCMNSLKYSGMNLLEKEKALLTWQKRWDCFVEEKERQYCQHILRQP